VAERITGNFLTDHDLHDTGMVGMIVIKRILVGDPQAYQEGDRHPGGEPGDIDERIRPVSPKVANGNSEKAADHGVDYDFRIYF
jgi:hypothetical protein